MTKRRKFGLLTREYPPEVYGGAGTHVEFLARELRFLADVTVHCWGKPRDEPGVTSHQAWTALSEPKPESAVLQAMSINLAMSAAVKDAELVHSHPGYAHFGGHLDKTVSSIRPVMPIHRLGPVRAGQGAQPRGA